MLNFSGENKSCRNFSSPDLLLDAAGSESQENTASLAAVACALLENTDIGWTHPYWLQFQLPARLLLAYLFKNKIIIMNNKMNITASGTTLLCHKPTLPGCPPPTSPFLSWPWSSPHVGMLHGEQQQLTDQAGPAPAPQWRQIHAAAFPPALATSNSQHIHWPLINVSMSWGWPSVTLSWKKGHPNCIIAGRQQSTWRGNAPGAAGHAGWEGWCWMVTSGRNNSFGSSASPLERPAGKAAG